MQFVNWYQLYAVCFEVDLLWVCDGNGTGFLFGRYGDLYTEKNVAISGIHTHAGPGGYLQYVVYIVTSLGFVRQSFDVLVDGIEKSITQAHENLAPGSIFVNKGKLESPGHFLWFFLNTSD